MTVYELVRGEKEPLITGAPLPANLLPSIEQWIRDADSVDFSELERQLGVSVALDGPGYDDALRDLTDRIHRSEEFAVRALAIILTRTSHRGRQRELAEIFESPGSKWEVVTFGGEHGGRGQKARLTLRQNGPVLEAVAGLAEVGSPAHRHLEKALAKLTTPSDKDPGGAYFEAVKAVEAAARPLVIPTDPLATLGKIIAALGAKPTKWAVVLAAETVEDVTRRATILWTTPHERHGSDEPDPPVTIEQAQAGFDLALGLVDYFARGLIYRVAE